MSAESESRETAVRPFPANTRGCKLVHTSHFKKKPSNYGPMRRASRDYHPSKLSGHDVVEIRLSMRLQPIALHCHCKLPHVTRGQTSKTFPPPRPTACQGWRALFARAAHKQVSCEPGQHGWPSKRPFPANIGQAAVSREPGIMEGHPSRSAQTAVSRESGARSLTRGWPPPSPNGRFLRIGGSESHARLAASLSALLRSM